MGYRSAALLHGWAVLREPERPEVIIHPQRRLPAGRRAGLQVAWRGLDAAEIIDGVTEPVRTVIDCATRLPFDEALAIADSALRTGDVTRSELLAAVPGPRVPGRRRALRVAEQATPAAANPMESALRAIVLDSGYGSFRPQLELTVGAAILHVDLGDDLLRLAVEAEGFQFHGDRSALRRDCRRYTLVASIA